MSLTAQDILGPGGRIAARLKDYEHRPEQLEMADAVAGALVDRKHLIVEAGTGVGKSFAYLVPAILAATQREVDDQQPKRRIVISTHTISLQEQLLTKDVPLLTSVIPREFTAVLVKGRSNYLSLRRLDNARERAGNLFQDTQDLDQMRHLVSWTRTTSDGSRSDLDYRPAPAVWDEVASDSGNCLSRKCPSYKQCFYFQARRRAQHAQILIVNHALFFSDLALRQVGASILPDYDAVILDEAHTVENVASEYLGLKVSSGQVEYILNKLYNDRTNKGLLVHYDLRNPQRQVDRCRLLAGDFFGDVQRWLADRSGHNGRVTTPEIVSNPLSPALAELAAMVRQQGQAMTDETKRQDFVAASQRLEVLADEIEQWRAQKIEQAVYWIEQSWTRRSFSRVTLAAAPIEVGPALRQQLFDSTDSVIMTSATLAVGRQPSFDFFKTRLGLTRCRTLRLGSPFNYREQAKVIVVGDMPDPASQKQQFEQSCAAMVQRYVARTSGRAFVLFTSYDLLRRVAARLTPWLAQQNLALYSQADGMPRGQMVQRFAADPRAVLFGTDSFWQGVDVPGDALQNVIITRLPFSVPDHPLLQARLDAIREAGRNPFIDYQLPEAVIKLRQGFGRLIRSQRDRGIVVILDPRVRSKHYGRVFLESLPECEVIEDSVHSTVDDGVEE